MEKLMEMACVGPQVGYCGVSGSHQGRQIVLARLMETQIWYPLTGSEGGRAGRSQKRNNGFC